MFCMNDQVDIVVEILQRLDERSLGVCACVCKLWRSITRDDSLWEHLCSRHVLPPMRSMVIALGGYRKLYMVFVRPVLSRLGDTRRRLGYIGAESTRRDEVQLVLSLFCDDYYERCAGTGDYAASSSSLMFLCK